MEEKKETYYAKNREKQLALANKYRETHKQQQKEYWQKYYLDHKDELRIKRREYARKNAERIREKHRTIYYPRHQAKKKQDVVEAPVELNPTVEVPAWTMIVSKGNHMVSFD